MDLVNMATVSGLALLCPINAINRAAYEHVHRSCWLSYMRASIELFGPPRTCECPVVCEAFHPGGRKLSGWKINKFELCRPPGINH